MSTLESGRRLGDGQGDAEDGVGTELALVGGPVEREHLLVDQTLVGGVIPIEARSDLFHDRIDGLLDALAAIARGVAVATLGRLEGARGGSGGHRRASDGPVIEPDLDLDGGVAPGIQDLPGDDCLNSGHDFTPVVGHGRT